MAAVTELTELKKLPFYSTYNVMIDLIFEGGDITVQDLLALPAKSFCNKFKLDAQKFDNLINACLAAMGKPPRPPQAASSPPVPVPAPVPMVTPTPKPPVPTPTPAPAPTPAPVQVQKPPPPVPVVQKPPPPVPSVSKPPPPVPIGAVPAAPYNPNLCSQCQKNPPNQGRKWCQPCFQASNNKPPQPSGQGPAAWCSKCSVKPCNPGKKWCDFCFQTDKGTNPVLCSSCSLYVVNQGKTLCGKCFHHLQGHGACIVCGGQHVPGNLACASCAGVLAANKIQLRVPPARAAPSGAPCKHFAKCGQNANAGFDLCGGCFQNLQQSRTGSGGGNNLDCLKCRINKVDSFRTLCPLCYGAIKPGEADFSEIFEGDPRWDNINTQFKNHPPTPGSKLLRLFAVFNPIFYKSYCDYKAKLEAKNGGTCNERRLFHGTSLDCDLYDTGKWCGQGKCAVCNIAKTGFDINFACTGRFGKGLYFAFAARKSHGYNAKSERPSRKGIRAMLLCKVAAGHVDKINEYDVYTGDSPRKGHDAILGEVPNNYPELIVHNGHAALPSYVLIYDCNQ